MYTLDTNVLIYHANGEEKVTDFLKKQIENNSSLVLPTIVALEFFTFPLDEETRRLFALLLPHLQITSLNYSIALLAADLRKVYKLKLGDSVVAATAIYSRTALATRNVRDFRIPNLRVFKI